MANNACSYLQKNVERKLGVIEKILFQLLLSIQLCNAVLFLIIVEMHIIGSWQAAYSVELCYCWSLYCGLTITVTLDDKSTLVPVTSPQTHIAKQTY